MRSYLENDGYTCCRLVDTIFYFFSTIMCFFFVEIIRNGKRMKQLKRKLLRFQCVWVYISGRTVICISSLLIIPLSVNVCVCRSNWQQNVQILNWNKRLNFFTKCFFFWRDDFSFFSVEFSSIDYFMYVLSLLFRCVTRMLVFFLSSILLIFVFCIELLKINIYL